MSQNNVTDLNDKRNIYSMLTKAANVHRALAYCDFHDLHPEHIVVDKDASVPIITVKTPDATNKIYEHAAPTGVNMMTAGISFAGQCIADIIWVKPLMA